MHHRPSICLEMDKAGVSPILLLLRQTHTEDDKQRELGVDPKCLLSSKARDTFALQNIILGQCVHPREWSSIIPCPQDALSPGIWRQLWQFIDMDCVAKERLWQGLLYCFTGDKKTNFEAPLPDSLFSGWGQGR